MLRKRRKKMKTAYSSVSLPIPLIEKIKETIQGTGYSSVSNFVEDLVRTALILRKENEVIKNKGPHEKKFLGEYKKRVEKRLKALGYLE